MAGRRSPKQYLSLEEFEREEINPHKKCGWSLDDLYQEAQFDAGDDESYRDSSPKELDFDY